MKLITTILLVACLARAGQQPANAPTEPGAYYKTAVGFVKLEQTMMAGGGARHVGKMFVPGLTPQLVYTFRGPHSPLQIAQSRPTFYIRQAPYTSSILGRTARDVVIVRFDTKKDRRELQITSGATAFTMKAGFSTERTPPITVSQPSVDALMVVPTEDLKPGEYLLTFVGTAFSGWDFGISKEEK
jgi:hypothetical protein